MAVKETNVNMYISFALHTKQYKVTPLSSSRVTRYLADLSSSTETPFAMVPVEFT